MTDHAHHSPAKPAAPHMLRIGGMSCATCAGRVEKALRGVPGVDAASVNFATNQASVSGADIADEALVAAVKGAGYTAQPLEHHAGHMHDHGAEENPRRAALLVIGAWIFALPFVGDMIWRVVVGDHVLPPLVQGVLATVVVFGFGAKFFSASWRALKALTGNMDLLVVLGTTAAYLLSAAIVLGAVPGGHHDLYFEAAAIVIAMVLTGRWLENRAKHATSSAIRALEALRPATARVRRAGQESEVPVDQVVVGDVVLLRPGESVPVDGAIVSGHSALDESMLSGESMPVEKAPGDIVIGGSRNGDGALELRATAIGANSRLSGIVRLVEQAQATRMPIEALVDRISAIFVPAMIAVALLTFAGWLLAGAPVTQAIVYAVTVLVIACPCALGLATPTVVAVGLGIAARRGILIRDAAALQNLALTDLAVFDKTGTLTEGRPRVVVALALDGDEPSLLRLAASVQQGSEHPLAQAMRDAVSGPLLPVADFRAQRGAGVLAMVEGRQIAIGNRALMQRQNVETAAAQAFAHLHEARGETVVFVAQDDRLAGALAIADRPRAHSAAAIASLKAGGIATMMLSGDTLATAQAIAARLGIDDVKAGVTPERKAEAIMALKAGGKNVVMVGDGVNDGPALAAADVGIAMGGGSDVALAAAHVALLREEPLLVPQAIALARRIKRKIAQNLFWAFIYNIAAVPLAALGLLDPVIAGAAMALSSVSVVLNALSLRWSEERTS